MTKYSALGRHLHGLPDRLWAASFKQLEEVLGFRLPNSARSYPAWWSNGSRMPQAAEWLEAGWRTEDLSLGSERITFRRCTSGMLNPPSPAASTPLTVDRVPLLGATEIVGKIDIRVGFNWLAVGTVTPDIHSALIFPEVSDIPGLYRFSIIGNALHSVYIGETEKLRRRFAHYRNPGPSQQTNIRLNSLMHAAIAAGSEIKVAVSVANAWIEREGIRETMDFSSKAFRCLAENAAILAEGARDIESLNRSTFGTIASVPTNSALGGMVENDKAFSEA